jgi:predicted transcriptional regulator
MPDSRVLRDKTSLSTRQRQVLTSVYRCGPCASTEYHVWKQGRTLGFWSALALYDHLKKLTDRGYLTRSGGRGSYQYRLTEKGADAINARFLTSPWEGSD